MVKRKLLSKLKKFKFSKSKIFSKVKSKLPKKLNNEKKTIIFDVDGTLADTFDLGVSIILKEIKKTKYKDISKDQIIDTIKNKNIKDVMSQYNLGPISIWYLVRKARKLLREDADQIKIFPGIKKELHKIKKEYNIGILTSNSKYSTNKILINNSIDLFDFKKYGSSVFGKSKKLNKIINIKKLNKKDVIYVGDETRDIDACKKIGLKVIAVSWGFNSKDNLKKSKPSKVIDNVEDLFNTIKELSN